MKLENWITRLIKKALIINSWDWDNDRYESICLELGIKIAEKVRKAKED